MSCIGDTCGTGGWGGPKAGDPSNNGVLTAKPAFGGIDVTWTYPTTNPHAVAHTILYRAIIPDFAGAMVIMDAVGSSFFYDKVEPGREFFYWIQFVSINGTYGEVIGPASSYARDSIAETIEQLTGKIDAGVLGQALKDEIARISEIDNKIFLETGSRLAGAADLSGAINQVSAITKETLTYVEQEIAERRDADAAMVQSINVLYAQAEGNAAAITEEKLIRAAKDEALSSQITTVESNLNTNVAQVQVQMQSDIKTQGDKIISIGALYTAKVNVNGLIGGFGIYNDGTTVEAGFDVDTFWLGRTGATKRKPFIVVGSEVFIDQAIIQTLTFNKLRADDGSVIVENGKLKAAYLQARGLMVQADNGVVGLNVDGAGNVTFGGTLNVKSAGSGQRTEIDNLGVRVYEAGGGYAGTGLRVRMGIW